MDTNLTFFLSLGLYVYNAVTRFSNETGSLQTSRFHENQLNFFFSVFTDVCPDECMGRDMSQ